MPRIIYIKAARARGYLLIGVAEGEVKRVYTVPEAVYSEVGSPARGEELDAETESALDEADNRYKAMRKALSLLSYADNSERALEAKLRRSGYSREVAEDTVREVVRLGYINDERQLERLILAEANTCLKGPLKLIPKLVSKGYSVSDIKAAISRLRETGELDFDENRRRLLDTKLPDDASDEEKYALLHKYGYKNA